MTNYLTDNPWILTLAVIAVIITWLILLLTKAFK